MTLTLGNYSPHATIGVGTVEYLDALLAVPFPALGFRSWECPPASSATSSELGEATTLLQAKPSGQSASSRVTSRFHSLTLKKATKAPYRIWRWPFVVGWTR